MSTLAERLERQEKIHSSAIDLTLDRVREVARRLDLLQPAARTITVAGTNGKGSTVAYLDALLRAGGLRTGRFTSPHLTRYNERICVDGAEASDAALLESFDRIDAARGDITLTFFEYNALAALDHFRREKVEVAVLEVGLGGRLDATNIVDADVGVVCSIGLDHTDWLGDSLEAIGREKAGIFREGRPAVLGTADMPRSVFVAIESLDARAVIPGRDFEIGKGTESWSFAGGGQVFRELPHPRLVGPHQIENAATALAAVIFGRIGVVVDQAQVVAALRSASIRGRFQVVPGAVQWVLDVAHNPPAARALADGLRALGRDRVRGPAAGRRTIGVCGILADKDVQGIAETLRGDIDVWIPCALAGPRGLSARDLAARLPADFTVIAQANSVAEACAIAQSTAHPGDRVVVFGSFLTVGPALEYLGI